ncbi:MAG: hypothetical protein PHR96_05025 [Clostridia bacterium]|jgi:hypothetical protein|nr:hypothetical protein [Clostridia bacterium]MDD3397880.1 hypothetical protein [Clostridia bacterium]
MKKINEEKFLADYELALKTKEDFVANKELAIEAEKKKVEEIVSTNAYSEVIKETLIALVVEEKEKEFDLENINSEIEDFEKYLIDVEEESEENSEYKNEEIEIEIQEDAGNSISVD